MNKLVRRHRKTRAFMHSWSRRGGKCVTLLVLAAVVLSLTAATVNAASPAASATNASPTIGATKHPIQYAIAGPPSMIHSLPLWYFKANGFSIVELVPPDNGTYQAELNTIKAHGMQPVIDIEKVIFYKPYPISVCSLQAYFQSLKNAGWEYVACEKVNSTALACMQPFFKGYVNYNEDIGGLYDAAYTNPFTMLNSWESYYPSEWPYIQNGSTQAAALGIQNGVMAGLWPNSNDNNQIYSNSLNGGSPSYKSMLDWSYANGIGFKQFCVWGGDSNNVLSDYLKLRFPDIVANLQNNYPATSTPLNASISTTTPY
jgi:hypothetical protein